MTTQEEQLRAFADRAAAEDARQRHAAEVYRDAADDPRVRAVLDVIAPRCEYGPHPRPRFAIFAWGREEEPTAEEVVELARKITDAIDAAGRGPS